MKRTLISSGSSFEAKIGYSRAVVEGDWIFVSGTTGFDYATMTISDVSRPNRPVPEEHRRRAAPGRLVLADVVRVTYILPNGGDFEPAGRCCRSTSASAPGRDDVLRRPRRPAHEDRDRGHRVEAGALTSTRRRPGARPSLCAAGRWPPRQRRWTMGLIESRRRLTMTDDAAHTHHAIDYIELSVRTRGREALATARPSAGSSTITAPVTRASAARSARWAGSRKRTTSRPAVRLSCSIRATSTRRSWPFAPLAARSRANRTLSPAADAFTSATRAATARRLVRRLMFIDMERPA